MTQTIEGKGFTPVEKKSQVAEALLFEVASLIEQTNGGNCLTPKAVRERIELFVSNNRLKSARLSEGENTDEGGR